MKPYYLFDPASGEYQGVYVAQESPMEPGVHIAPVHSTDTAPPELGANQAAVFAGGAWSVVPDHREQTWYDQATGEPVEIKDIGEPASHLGASLPAAVQLARTREALLASLASAYAKAMEQPVAYMGTAFQAGAASQDAITRTLAALAGQAPAGFGWLDANNRMVAMTYAELQGLAAAMTAQAWAAFQHLQERKAAARAAATPEEVQAVAW